MRILKKRGRMLARTAAAFASASLLLGGCKDMQAMKRAPAQEEKSGTAKLKAIPKKNSKISANKEFKVDGYVIKYDARSLSVNGNGISLNRKSRFSITTRFQKIKKGLYVLYDIGLSMKVRILDLRGEPKFLENFTIGFSSYSQKYAYYKEHIIGVFNQSDAVSVAVFDLSANESDLLVPDKIKIAEHDDAIAFMRRMSVSVNGNQLLVKIGEKEHKVNLDKIIKLNG